MKSEKIKKVLGFLVLKDAVSSKNLTSIALVALFFGVYIASGGRIAPLPKVERGPGFGDVRTGDKHSPTVNQDIGNRNIQKGNQRNVQVPKNNDREIDLFKSSPQSSANEKNAKVITGTITQGNTNRRGAIDTPPKLETNGAKKLTSFQERLNRLKKSKDQ